MREAISIIKMFKDTSFDARCSFHDEVVNSVIEGEESAIDIASCVKTLADICEAILKDISKPLIDEVDKAGGKYSAWGCEFVKKEAGTKYDYSSTGDYALGSLSELATNAANEVKRRQEFLKKLPDTGVEVVNEDTGEINRIYPPIKTSTTIVQISLPKGGV